MMFDRETQVVDCRCGAGLGKGGGLAQRGTLSEAGRADVVVIAMGPGQRHITKPVCEITYGMRKENIQVSVLVLYKGTGQHEAGLTGGFAIEPKEIAQINKHKMAVIHLGNVKYHIVKKAREILKEVRIPAITVSQAPVDFEDFAEAGIKTIFVKPGQEDIQTNGTIMSIVTGVTRGESCPRDKLNEIVKNVKITLDQIENNKGVAKNGI